MKKFTAILLATLMLVSSFVIAASAASEVQEVNQVVNNKVMKATAVVDGKLDANYAKSFMAQIKSGAKITGSGAATISATVYALYDDSFVYLFYQVAGDNTLMTCDPDYLELDSHPYQNDAVELRLSDFGNGQLAENQAGMDHHLFYQDAFAKRFSNYQASMGEDVFKKAKSAVVKGTNGYTVELAIPCEKAFKEGDKIGFQFQIDDLQDDANLLYVVALGKPHTQVIEFTCGGALPAETTTTTPTTGTTTTPTTGTTTAPTTSDATFIVLAVLLLSGVALVCVKRASAK